jgi:prepilin-type N-terminal cleavage/methylation domain-containing protein/prepilin-type processing-associated H-X9-DG protein
MGVFKMRGQKMMESFWIINGGCSGFFDPAQDGLGKGRSSGTRDDVSHSGAFTLIELLVVIAILAVLMAILTPTLNRVREQGKRAVCLNNVKQLAVAWNLYADDNDGRIVNGNTTLGTFNRDGACWVYWPGADSPEQDRLEGIRDGLLYEYCPNAKLYRCPTGIRGEFITYAIPDSMNGYYCIPGAEDQIKTLRSQIRNASAQIVFLDEGRLSPSSWTIYYDQERWWDQVTARHGDGTNFAFADGHSEYWKWKDVRTLEIAKIDINEWQNTARFTNMAISYGNEDLHRVQRGVFGSLGYGPARCEGGVCPVP